MGSWVIERSIREKQGLNKKELIFGGEIEVCKTYAADVRRCGHLMLYSGFFDVCYFFHAFMNYDRNDNTRQAL
jgi:hypothetical protein